MGHSLDLPAGKLNLIHKGASKLNERRKRGLGEHNVHLAKQALSPRRLMVAVKAEAGEAFFPHGRPAKHWDSRNETKSEIQ
jgi:hypothetical protein